MSAKRTLRAEERLAPDVAGYTSGHFLLKAELDHVKHVYRLGAAEAVIFYSARILEALAADALKAVRLPVSPNVFANLETLQNFDLIPKTTRYWAHTLRRSGNLVRHLHARVELQDAELSSLLLERWLNWYFCGFRFGLLLPSLGKGWKVLTLHTCEETRRLLEKLDDPAFEPRTLMAPGGEGIDPGLLRTPALSAVLIEMLLDRGEHDEAQQVLKRALDTFPDDLRLRQLRGLHYSRTGQLREAIAYLDPLLSQYGDDEELAGIMAGAYKRLWQTGRNNQEWLSKSHRTYLRAWERTRETNVYLGINAAATALWMGRRAESQALAGKVREVLRSRAAALAPHPGGSDLAQNYWDQVTLAEAELLSGDIASSRRSYRVAFEHHTAKRSGIKVSCQQRDEILKALGLPPWEDDFPMARLIPGGS